MAAKDIVFSDISYQLTTPVVLFIFRRPDTTWRVFETIAQAKPPKLFVIADGPRNAEEALLCAETRAIIDKVNWDCTVIKNYVDVNLGLKARISSGLNWVFDQVEEAIILEDDCLPDDTFFRFCQELLEKYRDEPRIMHISGDCFVNRQVNDTSYYFSRYTHVWGWATWKRAWKFYDGEMEDWKIASKRKHFLNQFLAKEERSFWEVVLDGVASGVINAWSYQWIYSCLKHGALAINPTVNLVSNIGFGEDATHTFQGDNPLANLPVFQAIFPLQHPTQIHRDVGADEETARIFFTYAPNWKQTIKKRLLLLVRIFRNDDH